jgi:hypothetical protein
MEVSTTNPTEAFEHFGIDQKEAEENAKKYSKAILALPREELQELFGPELETSELAGFALGIKPVVEIDAPGANAFAENFRDEVGDQVEISGNFLIWKDRAATVVRENRDVFYDFQDGDDIGEYIKKTLGSGDKQTDKGHLKYGLLFGYPKEAVEMFAKYAPRYNEFFKIAYRLTRDISDEVPKDTKDYLKNITYDFNKASIEKVNNFKNAEGEQVFQTLRQIDAFKDFTDEELSYISKNRGVFTKGMKYMAEAGSPAQVQVPKDVEKIFELSGMDQEMDKVSKEYAHLDYESDYPVIVNAVAEQFSNILGTHMAWGIMKENAGEDLVRDMSEVRAEIAVSLDFAQSMNPNPQIDIIREDVLSGFDVIRAAFVRAMKDSDGLYMAGTFNEFKNLGNGGENWNWIAKEAIEILHHNGVDVTGIIEELKDEPDKQKITGAQVFSMVFPAKRINR